MSSQQCTKVSLASSTSDENEENSPFSTILDPNLSLICGELRDTSRIFFFGGGEEDTRQQLLLLLLLLLLL